MKKVSRISFVFSLVLFLCFLFAPFCKADTLIDQMDFESGITSYWYRAMNTGSSYSYSGNTSTNYSVSPSHAYRFELHNTDPKVEGGKRSELEGAPEAPLQERIYNFSILLPSGGTEDYALDNHQSDEIIAQWHQNPDPQDKYASCGPPLSLSTNTNSDGTGHYWITQVWDSNAITVSDASIYGNHRYYDLGTYEQDKGKWVNWTFHVKWGWLTSQNPLLEVYKDGVLVLSNSLPNDFNDARGVNQQFGIYKWEWDGSDSSAISKLTKRVIYYDDVSVTQVNQSSATVSIPTFSPEAGTYTSAQTVTITSATSGSIIYYTTDGSTPTISSSVYSGAIPVSSSKSIRAMAIKSGMTNSAIGSATFNINIPTTVSTPTLSPAAGTYDNSQSVVISSATIGATIYYTTDGTTPTTSSSVYSSPVTVSSSRTIKALAIKTGYADSPIAFSAYTININTVATPTFSPLSGTYSSSLTVTISSATTGATIYYTTDGTTPTTSSSVYSSPVTVSSSRTIKALAIKTGYADSSVSSAAFTISAPSNTGTGTGGGTTAPAVIKTEATQITGNTVTLSFDVSNASSMMFSDNVGFAGSSWEIYTSSKTYTKSDTQSNLYIKFRSSSGDVSSIITLALPKNSTSAVPSSCSTGALFKIASSPKVYVIIDNKKKWISTPEVFEQLGYKWTSITVINDTALKAIPDYEDNLIRQIGDYKVFLVVNGVKRHIPSPTIFLEYGFLWTDVKDTLKETIDKYKPALLIKESGKDSIYYISPQEIRKLIPTDAIFNSYSDKKEDIQIVSKVEMESYPVSNLIKLSGSSDVYLIQGNVKKHIPSMKVFNKYKLNWSYIISVNQAEFDYYQNGGQLK